MTLGDRLRAWWWDYREVVRGRPGHCLICREGLAARDGGIDMGNGDHVCSVPCGEEYESRAAW